eukprot:CAMPEP_0184319512 /NCGR_PEP_ID=MMETSP1049-20130417/108957_1 /TAXON_ID=77928 /ORGANISM="Proteomonas sulcata, Strain CCMP704" /LENGTH=52 /DNA_ID=CAMNT_0026639667 /DNA_START=30 /DNA_END=185 /DNA_ORIENTATION=-
MTLPELFQYWDQSVHLPEASNSFTYNPHYLGCMSSHSWALQERQLVLEAEQW